MELWSLLGLVFGMTVFLKYLPEDHNKISWIPTCIILILSGPVIWVFMVLLFLCIVANKGFKLLDKFGINDFIKSIFTK